MVGRSRGSTPSTPPPPSLSPSANLGRASGALPVGAYGVFQPECGRRSYAENVSLRSARARPEKPTTLFKEMVARGPLANPPFLCLLKTPLPSAGGGRRGTRARRLTTGLSSRQRPHQPDPDGGMWAREREAASPAILDPPAARGLIL